jgi:DNA-binding beta-propeller fold protein YncE
MPTNTLTSNIFKQAHPPSTHSITRYGNTGARWIGTEYVRPHAVTIDHEDNVWLVDDMANVISKCDGYGKTLMTITSKGVVSTDPAEMAKIYGVSVPAGCEPQGGVMFNRPTDVAIHPDTGDIFITDGYGNSRVHRLTAEGKHIKSWGSPGTDAGQFNIPHNISIHPDNDKVIVVDRENSRVQLFTLEGEYVEMWHIHRAVAGAVGIVPDGTGKPKVLVAEQGSTSRVQKGSGMQISDLASWTQNIGHRIGVYSPDGKMLSSIGASTPGERPEQFNWSVDL